MKQWRIGIYDSDEVFAMRFMEYMNQDRTLPFIVLVFTNIGILKQYLQEKPLALLLSDLPLDADISVPVLRFTESAVTGERELYKFQTAPQLVQAVMLRFNSISKVGGSVDMPVYGVFSPQGRCGKTRLCLELAKQLPESIYIGFESFNSLHDYENSLEPYLYGIAQRNPKVVDALIEGLQPYYGSYVLASPPCNADVQNLGAEAFRWLFERLRERGRYHALVLDLEAGVFARPDILTLCSRIFVPVLLEEENRVERMKTGFHRLGYDEVLERMEYVAVPEDDELGRYVRHLLLR